MQHTILITGISGFLGSHIAERLSGSHTVIGLHRSTSDLWRIEEINNSNIILINTEEAGWQSKVIARKPGVLIHSAWSGVSAAERSDWLRQVSNLEYTVEMLMLAQQCGVSKVIGLGSQAEYGYYDGIIDEQHPVNPFSAYGAAKLAAMQIVKGFCSAGDIQWYWLRLFPLYGAREDAGWFIPMVITHALQKNKLDLSGCGQQYGYLHTSDFSRLVESIVLQNCPSGVYNVSGDTPVALRKIVEIIAAAAHSGEVFNFGALPYRENQAMLMAGDARLLYSAAGFSPEIRLEEALQELIAYYRKKYANNDL
jgi:nucleoside-diphosphate-sugar epimerase